MARWAKVGYLRRLVEFGPHTVAHEVPHDGAAVCFHVLLHRVGDIIDPVAGAGELDALPEALFGHMDQMHGLVAHLSAGEGGGAVAVEAVQKGTHVHADDVALLQLPGTGYAMDDFLVDRDTGGAGETAVAQEGSELLGFSVPELCFEPNDRLDITEYTQAAMVTAGIAMMRVLEEKGIHPDVTAGLSLGEYCALAAAGVMSDDDAIATVRQRGILMQEAVPAGVGAMAAILALDAAVIEEVTASMEDVWIANYNCPGQIVISGRKEAVEEACERLKAAGAKRAILLNVSGPFHSGMLTEAGEKLGQVLLQTEIKSPQIPYVANVTAQYVTEAAPVKELLTRQVSSSVKWQQSVETMLADGVDTFVEIGPGRTLTGFMRKIDRAARCFNVEKLEDIDKVAEALKEA